MAGIALGEQSSHQDLADKKKEEKKEKDEQLCNTAVDFVRTVLKKLGSE